MRIHRRFGDRTGRMVLGIALALLAPAAAAAQPQAPAPAPAATAPVTMEHHRSGLFLAIEAGYAGHSLSRGNLSASGHGFDVRVAGGFLATPRIAVFGGYSTFESTSVNYRQDGIPLTSNDTALDASSFFLGARGYLPLDFYLEASLGTLTERLDVTSTSGGVGAMGQLGAGKEWRLISGLTLLTELRVGAGKAPRAYGSAVSARHVGLYVGLGYSGD
jgi:hypothetical protein